MKSMPNHRPEHHFEETSQLAYHLWQQAHCPLGEDLKFWLKAEEQLFGKREQQSVANAQSVGTARPAGNGTAKSQPKTTKQRAKTR